MNRVRAGRQQLSAGHLLCRRKVWPAAPSGPSLDSGRFLADRSAWQSSCDADVRLLAMRSETDRPAGAAIPVTADRYSPPRDVPVALPPLPATALRRRARPGPRQRNPAQCRAHREGCPRLPVLRPARLWQDDLGPHPGQGPELHRPPRRRALRCLRIVSPRHQRRIDGRERARRRLQQRRRCHARARGPCIARNGRSAQGVHHRRGAHALDGGLQCPAEDARGAA